MQPTNTAYVFFSWPYNIMFHCIYKSGTKKKKIHRKVYNYKNVEKKLGALLGAKCSID